MSKDKDLGFQRSPRPEQSDQGAPDQPAKIAHRERVSADSRSRSAVLGLRYGQRGRGRSRADGATSSRIVLMLVKKPGNQLLQLELTGRVIHRSSVLKELPLDFSRKIIPLHDHRRAKT